MLGAALSFCDHGSRVVAADIEEGAQGSVVGAYDHDGLTGNVGGEELARIADLIEPACDLPCGAEDVCAFEFFDARVTIPGCRDGRGALQRFGGTIEIQYVVKASLHLAHL